MNKIKNTHHLAGFTLIELMTVIAIIGILASITFVSYGGARERARDAERVSELGQLALALERHFDACGQYPDASGTIPDVGDDTGCPGTVDFSSFIGSTLPTPSNGSYDYYVGGGNNSRFVLRADLEIESNPSLDDDSTGATLSVNCADTSGSSHYYCIES